MDSYSWIELGYSVKLESKITGFRMQVNGFTKWMSLVFNVLMQNLQDDSIFTDDEKIHKEIDSWIDSLENFRQNRP